MPPELYRNHVLIVEDSQGRHEVNLDSPVYSLGRDPKCDIRIASQYVSRRHATLVQLPDEAGDYYYRIVDGNLKGKPSANGILINGRKVQAHDLKDGDKVVFGPEVYAIYYSSGQTDFETLPVDDIETTRISPENFDDDDGMFP